MKATLLTGLMAAAGTFASASTDIYFTNPDEAYPYWRTDAYWTDASGNPLGEGWESVPVTNVNVFLGEYPNAPKQIIRLNTGYVAGDSTAPKLDGEHGTDLFIDNITGTPRHVVQNGIVKNSHYYHPNRVIAVKNPNDYLGHWEVGESFAWFTLPVEVGSGFKPIIHSLSTRLAPYVNVPEPSSVARIDEAYGGGAINKRGAGTLEIAETLGEATSLWVDEGTVSLRGDSASEDEVDAVLSKAALQLDASKDETLTFSEDDGRTWVPEWRDARGRTVGGSALKARFTNVALPGDKYRFNHSNPAFVSDRSSPTGLRMVSFGSKPGKTTLGPTNCYLKLNFSFQTVREVFFFADAPEGGRTLLSYIGGEPTDGPECDADHISTWSEDHYEFLGGGAKLFDGNAAQGEIYVNGNLVSRSDTVSGPSSSIADKTVCADFFNVSVSTPVNVYVDLLGCDRYYMEYSGGYRVGEILLFTNQLSQTERLRVNRYLREKWMTGTRGLAAGNVFATSSDVKIDVPDGRSSGIRSLSSNEKKLIKTGGGRLSVSHVTDGVEIDVRGGSVAFSEDVAVSTNAPAENPYLWLDASKPETIVTKEQSVYPDRTYVEKWLDCRPNATVKATSVWNYSITATDACMPTYVDHKGQPAVDFGSLWSSSMYDCAAVKFSNYAAGDTRWAFPGFGNTYAAFVVIRLNKTKTPVIFGSCGTDMYRREGQLLSRRNEYAKAAPVAALWTINGVLRDPFAQQEELMQTNDFMVVGVSGAAPMYLDGLGVNRNGASDYGSSYGGSQVSEAIIYNRQITESERRNTEAYLMAKWLGKAHPESSGVAVKELKLNSAESALVDADGDAKINKVSGENLTSLVKKGTGRAEIDVFETDGVYRSIVVEGGSLVVKGGRDFLKEAVFDFDASDVDSLVCEVSDGTTNVLKWLDRNGSGISAISGVGLTKMNSTGWSPVRHPTCQGVVFPDGAIRPAVDFGKKTEWSETKDKSAASEFTTATMKFSEALHNVREIHTVFEDIVDSYPIVPIVGNVDPYYQYYRGISELIRPAGTDEYGSRWLFEEGRADAWLNGEPCDYTTAVGSGKFVLASFSARTNTTVSGMALDRNVTMGGIRIAEQIAFSRQLSERERSYLQQKLMAKWIDGSRSQPVWTNELGSVSLSSGSSLELTGDGVYAVESLSGGGRIVTQGPIVGLPALAFGCTDGSQWELLTANGTVAFADAVTVVLTNADGRKLTPGSYVLFEADELVNASVSQWTVELKGFGNRSARLRCESNRIVAEIIPPGHCVIVR